MSFNTNYILPGDDKNQIIAKTNYNFSQVLSNSPGFPGEIGPIGSTGIIGQVGRDGLTGATGQKATNWYFQETAPYIALPYDERPLISGDIWVNTSPSGNQPIYTYNDVSWVSTGHNFISEGVFTTIIGITGPGEVNEDNAIVIGPTALTGRPITTFVFSDSEVTVNNANPTCSKVLVSTDASLTASLPIFSFDKTFYQSAGLPSFYWKDTGSDYDVQFSSDDSITIQSQATGTYSSTGGTVSLIGNSVGFDSNTATITGTGGININSPSIGLLGNNISQNNSGINFKNMSGGFSLSATGSSNSLIVDVGLENAQTGTRSAFTYEGTSNSGALNLSMSGNSLFRVTGGSNYSNIGIGFTGSTGITGGTGASVVKSYQSIVDSASSTLKVTSNKVTYTNNYIQVTPNSDVIVVTPNRTYPTSSDGRTYRIWLSVSGYGNPYVESGNVSVVDIYMNSTTYSIGGVYINTNFSFLNDNNKIKILDPTPATSIPGPAGGCRHIRLTYFGSPFNSTSDKQVYLQAFSSAGNNTSTVLTYEYIFRPDTQSTPTQNINPSFNPSFGGGLSFGGL